MQAQRSGTRTPWLDAFALLCAASAAALGCNAIAGIEPPRRDTSAQGNDLCVGVTCAAPEACHDVGTCIPETGQCSYPDLPDDTSCTVGDLCTPLGACRAGVCVSTGPDREWTNWKHGIPATYEVDADVVRDTATGLSWMRNVAPEVLSRATAQAYCEQLMLPGQTTGWRLPTQIELLSTVDYRKFNPAIDIATFPGTPPAAFWTSSRYPPDPEQGWVVNFDVGSFEPRNAGDALRVRCVR